MARELPSIRRLYSGQLWPTQLVDAFQHASRYFPTRTVHCGEDAIPLRQASSSLSGLWFQSRGEDVDLYDYQTRNSVCAMLVLKNSEIVLERYEYGLTQSSTWLSMSMAKSISATLVGLAIQDGYIRDIDDPLIEYMPKLQGGCYANVTVRQLLLMASGAVWNEDQTDLQSHRRDVLELQLSQTAGSILAYMNDREKAAPAGSRWNYSTGETHVVGELIRAATGMWLSDYLSEKVWRKAGMESNAEWWLECPDGLEVAGSGLNATLRDYGRFGLFVQNNGRVDGISTLPTDWTRNAAGPTVIGGESVGYGYMWWPLTQRDQEEHDGAFSARGIFGQRIYVNPASALTVVIWSARSKPMGGQSIIDDDMFVAVDAFLR